MSVAARRSTRTLESMNDIRISTTGRIKWSIATVCVWLAVSSALPGLGLVYGGHGSIFFLPALFQGFVGAALHTICFLTLSPAFLKSRLLALGVSAVAVVGGVVISAAYVKTDIIFFLESGAYVLSLPLSLIPAFLVSRIYAAVSSPQTSPSV